MIPRPSIQLLDNSIHDGAEFRSRRERVHLDILFKHVLILNFLQTKLTKVQHNLPSERLPLHIR